MGWKVVIFSSVVDVVQEEACNDLMRSSALNKISFAVSAVTFSSLSFLKCYG